MNILLFLILVVLFVLLTPGIVVYLPPKSSKLTTAITHGVIFAVIWSLSHKFLWRTTNRLTSMTFLEGATTMTPPPQKKPPTTA
jgi:hypothetical protein